MKSQCRPPATVRGVIQPVVTAATGKFAVRSLPQLLRIIASTVAVVALSTACAGSSGTSDTTGQVGDSLSAMGVGSGSPDSNSNTDSGTLVIGSVASLSGSAQAYGVSQQQGIELAVDREATGTTPVVLEVRDDASSPDDGKGAFRDLIEQGASVILGPTLSPVAAATNPLASAVGVPVLAVTNTTLTIDPAADSVWRITLSEKAMLPQGLAAIRQIEGIDTAVLVADDSDDYSRGAAEGFRTAAAITGVELTAQVTFDSTDFTEPDYLELLAQATGDNPDVVLFAARSEAATRLLAAAESLALPQKLVGSNGFNAPEVLAAAGPSAESLTVVASWNPAIDDASSQDFVAAYTERYGTAPDAFAAQGYAGVQVLMEAVELAGGTSPADVRRGLRMLSSVDTVLGAVTFNGNEAVYPAAIQAYRDGNFELITRGTPQKSDATP